ncbi:hypothetical protein BVG16_08985 [Paenibacillus selenitireducens]|uniref:HTH araC/xylS-type domain-containing protein n=1 Tax=Paenibacillus selenitireducens TaxID=1324314 RepID=A0A1T2XH51_9BACL|nr:AraC family transcriptional regulator [Paenibacillus selenitireducens]OPA79217.1 hypothetical protein BVG16_08985 [Paenibacillus selenitireducens]
MMKLWTEGIIYYQGYQLGMTYHPEDTVYEDHEDLRTYRILLIKEGTGVLQLKDRLYPIMAPGVYCFNDREHVRFMAGASFKVKYLRFQPSVLNTRLGHLLQGLQEGLTTDYQDLWVMEPFIDRTESYYGGMPLDPSVAKRAEELIEHIGKNLTLQPDCYWPCRSRSYLMELLFLIRQVYQEMDLSPHPIPHVVPESIKPVIAYLHTYYKDKIKLEHLTGLFHVNKTTLNESFKKSTGYSVISYLNHIRMRMADAMLRNTTLPTTEIMEMIGIHDDAHFIRNFRKHSGYSPAEYRNKYCWMLHKSL